ncbi:MAG: M48 family metallopeptidase, partial [Bacteroidota bacterium]
HVSAYVTEIANELLEAEPTLQKKLRFYAVRTPSVNAFATGQGVILINMGLIAQLENEAQLAFILAHEIAHYREKHALEFYLESKALERGNRRGFFKKKNIDTKLAKNQFSKEQETEADALGLELFLKSDYDLNAVQGAFDVLQYSYLPFDDVVFDKSYFEDEYLVFPPKYQIEKINPIASVDDVDDARSTHPSLASRRLAADKIIQKENNTSKQKYLISENRFRALRKKARFDLMEYNLRNYEYYEAIYHAYLLQQDFPENIYLKKIIAKALYGAAKFSNHGKFDDITLDHEEVQGEFGSLVYFINQLKKIDLNVLALRYAYHLKDDFQNDEVFQNMIEDLCQELVNKHGDELEKFKAARPNLAELYPPKVAVKEEEKEEEDKEVTLEQYGSDEQSKLEKIRNKTQSQSQNKFFHYGLGDFWENADFQDLLEKCKKNKAQKEEDAEKNANASSKRKSKTSGNSKGNYALGEKRVMVINPFYLKLKKGYKKPLLIKTEKAQVQFSKIIGEVTEILELDIVVLDADNLSKRDVEKFNDLVVIQEWFSQQMENEEDFQMIPFNQERINAIAEKYNVDTFVWTGLITGKSSKNSWELIGQLIFVPPAWLYSLATPKGQSIIFALALDANSGTPRMTVFDFFKRIDHKDILKQRLYDIFWQVKHKPN